VVPCSSVISRGRCVSRSVRVAGEAIPDWPRLRFIFADAAGSKASLNEALGRFRTTLLSYEGREGGDLGSPEGRMHEEGLSQRCSRHLRSVGSTKDWHLLCGTK